ncbi:MAG TPA: hypothetical protein VFW14_14550 [Gaiellales bacterium]|nr:hypothetical protein [Gaiellales bacterium]
MHRLIPQVLTIAAIPLPVFAAGCGGSSSGTAAVHHPRIVRPFAAPIDFEGGSGSGLWGDTASSLGCLPGRRYAVAVTLRNRSAATVTITHVGGAEPAPRIIRRIANQARVAPPPPTGDAVMIVLRAWSARPLVPVAIPPGKGAVVQSNFLMGHCNALRPHDPLTVNGSMVVSYRIGALAGRQVVADPGARIVLTRGPTMRRCGPPERATGLIAWDLTCSVAARAATGCRRLPHGTWGSCTAASRPWDCTFTSASRLHERCWLATKRQSISVHWS